MFLLPSGVFAAAKYKGGTLLVKFKTGSVETGQVHLKAGTTVKRKFERLNIEHIALPPGLSVEDAIALYTGNPEVEYAEPDYYIKAALSPNDPYFINQWGLHNIGQTINGYQGTADADIDAPEAWDLHTGSGSVIVATIDTGVDYNHEDLSSNIWTNAGETPENGVDDDGNGYVDDNRGWNFVGDDYAGDPVHENNNPMDDAAERHGTIGAGIIGASCNNSKGVCGVNWSVKIMPLKVLDSDGGGSVSDEIAAIEYAVEKGAKVINASFTYNCAGQDPPCPSQSEKDAIKAAGDAGVLYVTAAGNYGTNNDTDPYYPASHGLPNIISVAASDINDERPYIILGNGEKYYWSNYGSSSVHLAAPGFLIYSTGASNGYAYQTGTSFSAPFVSGAAALLFSYKPSLSHINVKDYIIASVDAKGYPVMSGGRLNVYKALTYEPTVAPPPAPEPAADTTVTTSQPYTGRDSDSRCFIATAAYGTPLAPEVMTLRAFRDKYLINNPAGKAFVELYYRHSPVLAEYISGRPKLRFVARTALEPVVFAVKYPIALIVLPLIVYNIGRYAKRRKRER